MGSLYIANDYESIGPSEIFSSTRYARFADHETEPPRGIVFALSSAYYSPMDPIKAIRFLRREGWTQAQIGEYVGMTQVNISRIASGKQKPLYGNGARICELAEIVARGKVA